MNKTTAIKSVQDICTLLESKGITQAVISPGSRNAPITIALNRSKYINTFVAPDERSAAFIALGMAMESGQPVVVSCTSGSAVANYLPAITEAHYQSIPIVVLSADRPEEFIDQLDGQTIRQQNILGNFVSYFVNIRYSNGDSAIDWQNQREVNYGLNKALELSKPIHINVPLREPLYNVVSEKNQPQIFEKIAPLPQLSELQWQRLSLEIGNAKKIMVLAGQHLGVNRSIAALQRLAQRKDVLVLSETTSNLHGSDFIMTIDRLITGLNDVQKQNLKPDLLITFGGAIVSKRIKAYLRSLKNYQHWHIGEEDLAPDTYQNLSQHIAVDPAYFFNHWAAKIESHSASDYVNEWQQKNTIDQEKTWTYIQNIPFGDLFVFAYLSKNLHAKYLHVANSSAIRYTQLFEWPLDTEIFCNRGTSGIDGCTSTALGYALNSKEDVWLITGDISFFYDSNAFFNQGIPHNLKIILINNGGGNIFSLIDGPRLIEERSQFFEAQHQLNGAGIASTFGLRYLQSNDTESFIEGLAEIQAVNDKPVLFEIFTEGEQNQQLLKDFFKTNVVS